MHFEDSDGSLFSIRSNPKSQSRMDFGMKGSIPRFSHHPADLTKKSILTTNIPKTTQAQYSSTRPGVLSKIDLNSLSNLSLSPKNEKHERPYRSKEVAPKVLNMSHDADNPNPGPETEGDSSIVRHNHSRNEIRVMDQPIFEDIDVNHSPVSRSRRNLENGNDSSRFYFFNQNSMHQVRGPSHIDLAQDLHQSQPIIIDNPVNPVQVGQVEQRIEIPERHVAGQAQEVTPEQAADWQHELSIRANHKFRVLQWSVIFVVLASLIGYASITGETPATVLYVILFLTAILHIYSILRFCNRKLLCSRKGLNKILKLSDWIFLIAYSVGTLIKIQKPEIYTVFYLTPLPLSVFIRLLFIRKKTSNLRIILWLQVVVFTLKIDNILMINWLLIFVIAFGFSAGFIIRIFYLIYIIKNKRDLAKELPEENHLRLLRMKMLGLGWDILVSSYSIIMVLFFYGLAEKLENTQNGNIMGATLLVAMVYSIFILYLTLKFKYEITRSIITKIIRNDKDHIKMKEILQKELEVGISSKSVPKQLVRVSATYYQVVTSESKAKTEKGENKSKPTFITVGDLAANANIEEEKEEDNNKADSQNENEQEEISEKEEEEDEQEEEKGEEPDKELPKTKNNKSGNRFRFLFRKRRVSKHSYSESDMPQDADEEEESPSSQIKSEEDAQDEDPHCFVCCDRIANTVIMNCGHGGLCYQCGLDMWKKEEKCYLCRQKISKLLRLNKDHEYTDTPGVQIATTLNKDRKINVNDSFQDILNDI